ncbi:MAG: sigma-70 family RNA polymerase sigma factor, partial [Acidobacteriota bacterium]
MAPAQSSTAVNVDAELVNRLYRRSGAKRWALSETDFAAALGRSITHRFEDQPPASRDVQAYLESLRLDDLALACACARGHEPAWEHFVREFRPALLRAAASCAPPDLARELADSIYADLFGLEERDGVRRSLFDYFHGRSSLASWLRAVIAQRVVDRARSAKRFEALPDDESALGPGRDTEAPDVDKSRYLSLGRSALSAALAALLPGDRLRLALYYTQQLTLAAAGRVLGESEATVSRKLERTRRELRAAIERRLREVDRLSDAQVAA